MTQPAVPAALEVRLGGQTDLAGFRSESQQLLAHQVHPDTVRWLPEAQEPDPFAEPLPPSASRPRAVARAASAIVPASFLRLCESVVLHRDPDRFALLYRLLWRLVHEPGLRHDPMDADMLHAQHMAHAVRRDIHKMKSSLRLVPMPAAADDADPLHVGWFDPTHHILEVVAPWFAKRQGGMRWVIMTPARSVRWDRERLMYGPGLTRAEVPDSEADAVAWLQRCDAVFGARVPA